MDSIKLTIPGDWTDQTSQVSGVAALLRLQAPASYGTDNATFMLVSVPGPRAGSSSHEQGVEDAAGYASLGPQSSVSDCTVGGASASFYQQQYPHAEDVERLLILHSPTTKYPLLYAVEITSQGQVDDRAAAVVRAILGSWAWGPPRYDPNS
jgi:hypothetical protein